ncbi:hypothetical protein P7K49_022896 [Saguinus oedipus]|uniref:Uncharacterized protein n=1 Tax=Saguinus oedipus TaxID=9490 RepID=A0ABQ9UK26_SAGOE|nr:hypothetical protein P7K49_022896 [Saguinus oedipus]
MGNLGELAPNGGLKVIAFKKVRNVSCEDYMWKEVTCMGITGNTSPFGQPFSQAGGQPMGATGVNPQLASKQSMVNSLPTFPTDIKNTSVTNVPNMHRSRTQKGAQRSLGQPLKFRVQH